MTRFSVMHPVLNDVTVSPTFVLRKRGYSFGPLLLLILSRVSCEDRALYPHP